MESLETIISQFKEDKTKYKDSSMNSLQKTKQNEIVKNSESQKKFLLEFSPAVQERITSDIDLCYFGKFPTLAESKRMGSNTPVMWLMPQLFNLSEYCGCRDKMTKEQLYECASLIASEYYYLKISELMLFFRRFKLGKYGRFYGSVDPMIITTSLRTFVAERNEAYSAHEFLILKKKMEEDTKNSITYEEYLKLKKNGKLGKSNCDI